MVAYKGKEKYIFVSYAHKDSERVLPILDAMQRAGFRVWYDTGIEAGTEWPAYIEESLEKSSVVIAFLSPHSVESVNCRNEINYALLKQKEMLVIYLEDTELRYGLGLQLNSLQSLFKFRHQTERSFIDELLKAQILQDCKKSGGSFEEMRRMNVKNGKRKTVLKTVLITPEKQEDPAITESERKYNNAVDLIAEERYEEAITAFEMLNGYKDSNEKIAECNTAILENKYENAVALMDDGKYAEAIAAFELLGVYKDSTEKIAECNTALSENEYDHAVALMNEKKYAEAIAIFETLDGYKDSNAKIAKCNKGIARIGQYDRAVALMDAGKYAEAKVVFETFDGYKKSNEKIAECNAAILESKYDQAVAWMNEGKYVEAGAVFESLNGYKDSYAKSKTCKAANSLYKQYREALDLVDRKKYRAAYAIFTTLGTYGDSVEKAKKLKFLLDKKNFLAQFKIGNTVKFGSYPQRNDEKEDIEWQVLDIKDGKALLLSTYALDCKKYNTSFTNVMWGTCTLRKWLNQDFLNTAFSEDEKAMIPTVTVSPLNGRNSTAAAQDQVFLLSITEAMRFFPNDRVRVCKPTEFAVANGAYVNGDTGNCWWWLRSPGFNPSYASFVDDDGAVSSYGGTVLININAIRPALWVSLEG